MIIEEELQGKIGKLWKQWEMIGIEDAMGTSSLGKVEIGLRW